MNPEDVPGHLIVIACDRWRAAPQKRDGKPTRMRYALAAVISAIERQAGKKALHDAAQALLAEGWHDDGCSYGPPGTCDCWLRIHYRWLIKRGGET